MIFRENVSNFFRLTSVFVASGLLCAWTLATAEDFTKRFYINGGIGATHVEPESSSDVFQISDNNDSGAHLGLGYDLNRFLSLEAYAVDMGEAEVEFLGTRAGDVGYQVYGISALGYLLNSRSGMVFGDDDSDGLFRREGASLYGRVGWGHMINDPSGVNSNRDYPSHAAFGLGLEYGFRNGFALRSELMTFDTDAKYWNIGILKRFGSVREPLAAAAALPAVASALPAVEQPEAKAVAPQETVVVPKPVVPPTAYFEFDSSDLDAESEQNLAIFAEAMAQNDLQLNIEGHTDHIATESYNMSLSIRRAEAVSNFLVSKGVAPERITTMGYGETRPISTNNTEQGRAVNRRTEIHLR